MLTATLKIDTEKLAMAISKEIDVSIEEAELLEPLSEIQKTTVCNIVYYALEVQLNKISLVDLVQA